MSVAPFSRGGKSHVESVLTLEDLGWFYELVAIEEILKKLSALFGLLSLFFQFILIYLPKFLVLDSLYAQDLSISKSELEQAFNIKEFN